MSNSYAKAVAEGQEKMNREISLQKLLKVADSSFDPTEDFESEYARGCL